MDGLDTPLEVDTKIANALLGLATEAFVAAQLASRDAGITALQASKADTALLASYATNAALSASETALQSALDAILAELAALQLSGSGVVNAPAWAGFTTWELLRGSSVVRNLRFVAPLSAVLANGDDTLSITADCYSTAGTDAAITAALLAYYTSSQVDTLLGDYRTGAAQDAETQAAITGALLAYYTAAQVDALLGDYRTASAQDTQTQAAITGALLAYRTGPDQDVFTTNQITSALVAYRSAADQDTATASSIAAASPQPTSRAKRDVSRQENPCVKTVQKRNFQKTQKRKNAFFSARTPVQNGQEPPPVPSFTCRSRTSRTKPHCLPMIQTCRASTLALRSQPAKVSGLWILLPSASQKRTFRESSLHFRNVAPCRDSLRQLCHLSCTSDPHRFVSSWSRLS